jgi:hypothetical protein
MSATNDAEASQLFTMFSNQPTTDKYILTRCGGGSRNALTDGERIRRRRIVLYRCVLGRYNRRSAALFFGAAISAKDQFRKQGYLIFASERRVLNVVFNDHLAIQQVLGCTAIEHGTTFHTENQLVIPGDEPTTTLCKQSHHQTRLGCEQVRRLVRMHRISGCHVPFIAPLEDYMTMKLIIDTSLDGLGGPLVVRVFRKQLTVEQARAIKREFGWMGALMLERLLSDELTEDDCELIRCHDDLQGVPDAAQAAIDQLPDSETERLYD